MGIRKSISGKAKLKPPVQDWQHIATDDPRIVEGLSRVAPPAHIPAENLEDCPLCHGCGKHHYAVNNVDGVFSTKHCSSCNGWGYVSNTDPHWQCAHDFYVAENVGRCLNMWRCRKCPKAVQVDSSD